MFLRTLNKSSIKKILVISLSNIGDVILTLPVVDILKSHFPSAQLSVVVGPKVKDLLLNNPHFFCVHIFNKRQPLQETLSWLASLRKEKFDLVVDLRHTAIPILITPRYRTPIFVNSPKGIHMKEKHLGRLKSVFDFASPSERRFCIHVTDDDKAYVENLLNPHVKTNERFVIVAAGAANNLKRWREDSFAVVCDEIIEKYKMPIVFVGDENDREVTARIKKIMRHTAFDLCGRTNLIALGELLRRSSLAVANDSAVMHMASYLDVPVVAIFGPTDPAQYGPWGSKAKTVKSTAFCTACHQPHSQQAHECMDFVKPAEVLSAVAAILDSRIPNAINL